MVDYSEYFRNEEELKEAQSRPTHELIKMMKRIERDFIFLGVVDKMEVSMICVKKQTS